MLHGSADPTAPLAGAQQLVVRHATWEIRILDGVDHHPWLRVPHECLQYIEQWLVKLSEQTPVNHAEQAEAAHTGLGRKAVQ